MRLVSTVKARSDGTLSLLGASGAEYAFVRDEQGRLVGDVPDGADARAALLTGNFYPASEDDEARAAEWMAGDDDDGDMPADLSAPPVEGVTHKRGRKPKAQAPD